MVHTVNVIIVDDEPIARRGIRQQLAGYPDVNIVEECRHGAEAVETIQNLRPDLVFLDIQMPEMNGFEVVRTVGVEAMPTVIFVTAYDEHALEAFQVHAFDYLLKPVDPERFRRTFQRAVDHLRANDMTAMQQRLQALMQAGLGRVRVPAYFERLVVKEGGRIFFVDTSTIRWIESAGNYVTLHTEEHKHLLRETMHGILTKLNPQRFVRISRSTIVNTRHVKAFVPYVKGRYFVQLHDGTQLTSSQHYRAALDDFFANMR